MTHSFTIMHFGEKMKTLLISRRATCCQLMAVTLLVVLCAPVFGANNPDPDNRAFIALSDRSLALGGLINHYSLGLWKYNKSQTTINVNTTYGRSDLESKPTVTQADYVEMLSDSDRWAITYTMSLPSYTAPYYYTIQVTDNTKVSYVSIGDDSTDIMPILEDQENTIMEKWNQVMSSANSYGYAEHTGMFFSSIVNWQNSYYEVGNFVNNSNTFARYMLNSNSISFSEMGGTHPGRIAPVSIQISTWGSSVPHLKP